MSEIICWQCGDLETYPHGVSAIGRMIGFAEMGLEASRAGGVSLLLRHQEDEATNWVVGRVGFRSNLGEGSGIYSGDWEEMRNRAPKHRVGIVIGGRKYKLVSRD